MKSGMALEEQTTERPFRKYNETGPGHSPAAARRPGNAHP
jgi:hypothetical protein